MKKDKNGIKNNRLDGEQWSIQEAKNGITQNGKNIDGRILIGINNDGELVIEDGMHLLEAYRQLGKDIPIEKISFRNQSAENLFQKSL